MEIPTLVVSDPPHGEVNVEAAAELLELDVFAARLKSSFGAPEVMLAGGAEETAEFAAALRSTGFSVSILDGAVLASLPWPDPVSTLAFDVSRMRATVQDGVVDIPYDAEVVVVSCRPPTDRFQKPPVDLDRAVSSGHGPTIAEAIRNTSVLDLYFLDEGALRRVTVVPALLELDGERVEKELVRRFKSLMFDARLVGVRPRSPFGVGRSFDGPERRRYSFGTLLLRQVLESIAPELRAVPQYEFGSRLAYALHPLGGPG